MTTDQEKAVKLVTGQEEVIEPEIKTNPDEDKPEMPTDPEEEDHTKLLLAELENFAKLVRTEEVNQNIPTSQQITNGIGVFLF